MSSCNQNILLNFQLISYVLLTSISILRSHRVSPETEEAEIKLDLDKRRLEENQELVGKAAAETQNDSKVNEPSSSDAVLGSPRISPDTEEGGNVLEETAGVSKEICHEVSKKAAEESRTCPEDNLSAPSSPKEISRSIQGNLEASYDIDTAGESFTANIGERKKNLREGRGKGDPRRHRRKEEDESDMYEDWEDREWAYIAREEKAKERRERERKDMEDRERENDERGDMDDLEDSVDNLRSSTGGEPTLELKYG